MIQTFRDNYWRFASSFGDSSVIVWSRAQVALGSMWFAFQGVDMSPILTNPKHLMGYLIFSNFINEMLRRNGAEKDDQGNFK